MPLANEAYYFEEGNGEVQSGWNSFLLTEKKNLVEIKKAMGRNAESSNSPLWIKHPQTHPVSCSSRYGPDSRVCKPTFFFFLLVPDAGGLLALPGLHTWSHAASVRGWPGLSFSLLLQFLSFSATKWPLLALPLTSLVCSI